jgi:hypothetical protein
MSDLRNAYAGYLVDSHITEDDATFLSRLDPAAFVEIVSRTGADSVMVYACCHNLNSYYPTKVGHMHRNLQGCDVFGEMVRLLRKRGIIPRAYYTVVYARRAARENPDWRITQIDGRQSYRRSWYCCPNSPGYRQFAKAQIAEICGYDIDAIFIDMTFWPGVCFCPNCRGKYRKEIGEEIPTIVDWSDPRWVKFQRTRERWLSEFAHDVTAAAKAAKPGIVVAHQFSPVLLGWMYGQTHALSQASDVPSGDFYGGKHQQRLGTKVLAAFRKELPYEFMTSRCVNLYDHTSTKSDTELLCSCATTLANAGKYMLIDAINPDGTLVPAFYERLARLAGELQPYKRRVAALRPVHVADTALYFSMASHVRRDHNGQDLRKILDPANNMLAASDLKPVQELLGTSIVLNRCKIPYRVVTDHTTDFDGLRTIVLNDISFLSPEEVARLRQFVNDGGTLIATGMSSYYDLDGRTSGDFALKDVFGVTYSGKFSKQWSYLVPESGEMVSSDVSCPLVNVTTATALAQVAEPLFDFSDLEHFASYHSNPPGKVTESAALAANRFGRGTCIYLYSSLLSKQQEAQQVFGESVFRRWAPSSIVHATNAPHAVEITLLRGTTKGAFLLCLVNFQDELPNIPIRDIEVTLSLPGKAVPAACRSVSTNEPIAHQRDGGRITLRIPQLRTFEMIELETEDTKS